MITEENLRGYIKCLVANLKNINKPDEFDPNMRFRDIPRMFITITEGKMFIEAEFEYLSNHVTLPLSFGANKFSEITDRGIDLFIGNEEATINGITRKVYRLLNNCKC